MIPIQAFSHPLNIKHKEFVKVLALKLLLVFVSQNSTILIIDIKENIEIYSLHIGYVAQC